VFALATEQIKSICLTATPDDQDEMGMEKKVVSHFKFLCLSSVVGGREQPVLPVIPDLQERELPDPSDIYSFCREELKESAVLLYCTMKCFKKVFKDSKLSFTLASAASDTELRNLDQRGHDGLFRLLIATDASPSAMRGLDFRAPAGSITLLVAASFPNVREASQGLYRVGRFGDACKRLIVAGVPLVDEAKKVAYQKKLADFCNNQLGERLFFNQEKNEEEKAQE
jgi:hypothetical protein